jgi:hypothetical protein
VKRRRVLQLQGRLRKSTTAWLRLESRSGFLDRYIVSSLVGQKGANWKYHLSYGTIMIGENTKVVWREGKQRFRKVIACSQCLSIDKCGTKEGANNVNEPFSNRRRNLVHR